MKIFNGNEFYEKKQVLVHHHRKKSKLSARDRGDFMHNLMWDVSIYRCTNKDYEYNTYCEQINNFITLRTLNLTNAYT